MSECQKCKGTGLADSGGVQPWGEPILIECDCKFEEAIMEESRVQFERKVGQAYGEDYLIKDEEGDYTNWLISDLWDIWQASRAAIEVNLPKAMGEHQVQWDGTDWNMMREHAVNAIRAAGLKIKGE